MADSVAEKLGVDVWVPDQFAGKAFLNLDDLNGLAPEIPGDKRTFLGTLQLLWLFIRRLPRFIQSRPSVCDARMSKFVKGLRNDQGYKTIGAIGYCWGGGVLARISGTDIFDSAVIAHPSPVPLKQIMAIKCPTAFACAEKDPSFSLKFVHECEAALEKRKKDLGGPDFEFKEYKGVCHGFAFRPVAKNPVHKERFVECFQQTAAWFEKMLKQTPQA